MERTAMEAEREIVDLKKMQFMEDKVGDEFDGFITGVMNYGLFVELVDYFVEGMVHVSQLPADHYRYWEKQHALVGEKSRKVFRIGDRITIKVANVSLEKRQIEFTPVDLINFKSGIEDRGKCDDSSTIKRIGKRKMKGKTVRGRGGAVKKDSHRRR